MKLNSWLPTRDYVCNHLISSIPILELRMAAYRSLGLRIGNGSSILMGARFVASKNILIGDCTVINADCHLDGRGGLAIGSNVNISSYAVVVSGTHDIQDPGFNGLVAPVTVEDYVWLCTRSMLLPGVTIGEGAVVAAGAVVTRSVPPFTVVGGIPARKIGERSSQLAYALRYDVNWI